MSARLASFEDGVVQVAVDRQVAADQLFQQETEAVFTGIVGKGYLEYVRDGGHKIRQAQQ